MPCTHQLARARQQDTCHLCGFDLRGGSATLSEAANQALCWLMSEQASRVKCGEARAAILEGFGRKVDEELQAFFCSQNSTAMPQK
jgi:hypothetical protein